MEANGADHLGTFPRKGNSRRQRFLSYLAKYGHVMAQILMLATGVILWPHILGRRRPFFIVFRPLGSDSVTVVLYRTVNNQVLDFPAVFDCFWQYKMRQKRP